MDVRSYERLELKVEEAFSPVGLVTFHLSDYLTSNTRSQNRTLFEEPKLSLIKNVLALKSETLETFNGISSADSVWSPSHLERATDLSSKLLSGTTENAELGSTEKLLGEQFPHIHSDMDRAHRCCNQPSHHLSKNLSRGSRSMSLRDHATCRIASHDELDGRNEDHDHINFNPAPFDSEKRTNPQKVEDSSQQTCQQTCQQTSRSMEDLRSQGGMRSQEDSLREGHEDCLDLRIRTAVLDCPLKCVVEHLVFTGDTSRSFTSQERVPHTARHFTADLHMLFPAPLAQAPLVDGEANGSKLQLLLNGLWVPCVFATNLSANRLKVLYKDEEITTTIDCVRVPQDFKSLGDRTAIQVAVAISPRVSAWLSAAAENQAILLEALHEEAQLTLDVFLWGRFEREAQDLNLICFGGDPLSLECLVRSEISRVVDGAACAERRNRRLKVLEERRQPMENPFEEFFVHESLVGLVIGKQGENLMRVSRNEKVEIRVFPDEQGVRRVRIYGLTSTQIAEARKALDYQCFQIDVPELYAEWLTAEKQRIKELCHDFDIFAIWLDESGETMSIGGLEENVLLFIDKMEAKYLESLAPSASSGATAFTVDSALAYQSGSSGLEIGATNSPPSLPSACMPSHAPSRETLSAEQRRAPKFAQSAYFNGQVPALKAEDFSERLHSSQPQFSSEQFMSSGRTSSPLIPHGRSAPMGNRVPANYAPLPTKLMGNRSPWSSPPSHWAGSS